MTLSDEIDTTRTGLRKLHEEMIAQELARKQREDVMIAQVQRVADAWDTMNKRQITVSVAAKRALKQFLSSIGWLE